MRDVLNRFVALTVVLVLLVLYWPFAVATEDNFQAQFLRTVRGSVIIVIFANFTVKLRRALGRAEEILDIARRFYLDLLLWLGTAWLGAWWRLADAATELTWIQFGRHDVPAVDRDRERLPNPLRPDHPWRQAWGHAAVYA